MPGAARPVTVAAMTARIMNGASSRSHMSRPPLQRRLHRRRPGVVMEEVVVAVGGTLGELGGWALVRDASLAQGNDPIDERGERAELVQDDDDAGSDVRPTAQGLGDGLLAGVVDARVRLVEQQEVGL